MRVCLFEDRHVDGLEPLTLTRPAYELLCGMTTLGHKQRRAFPEGPTGALVRPLLADLQRQQHPGLPVNDLSWLRAAPVVLVNARWLPPERPVPPADGPCVAVCGDEVAYAVLEPGHLADCLPGTIDDCLGHWRRSLPAREAGGQLVRHLWELVDANGEQVIVDFAAQPSDASGMRPQGLAVVGPSERLRIDPLARLDPMIVVDTTAGPVVVGPHAFVSAFSRLEGPCYVGEHTHVLGAKVRAGTTLGPSCRVGGEVEASIVLGHSNKYHEGFLGHSYVGEWVNLGAGTHNSDLRNDYGPIAVVVAGRVVETGRSKVGCFLGDHTKTGLGTLLNTGTVAGVFCNLLPWAGYGPKLVPSFCSVWQGRLRDNADLPALLATAGRVMARRDVTLTDAHAELYRGLLAATARDRQRALRDADQRRLRRSA